MITIKRTLDRENENAPIRDARILQGNFTNLEFRFNLADSGDSVTVTNSADIVAIVKAARNDINTIIPSASISISNNEVVIAGNPALVNQYGIHTLVLQFKNLYTFSIVYSVAQNPAYEPVPISAQDHSAYALKTEVALKLDKDLSNVDTSALETKTRGLGFIKSNLDGVDITKLGDKLDVLRSQI